MYTSILPSSHRWGGGRRCREWHVAAIHPQGGERGVLRAYVNLCKRRHDVTLGPYWNNCYCSKGDYPLVMLTVWYWKLPFSSLIYPLQMMIFHSFLYAYQRVLFLGTWFQLRDLFFYLPRYNVNDKWGDFMGYITNFKIGCVSKCLVDRIPPNCHYMFSARRG